MVKGRCDRQGCGFAFEDADSNPDAVAKLAAHYRTEHRPKAFHENRTKDAVEIYNYTLDEAIASYAGAQWREQLANGRRDSRHITRACANVCQYPWQYHRDLVAEVQALSLEHGVAIPDPYEAIPEPNGALAFEEPY